MPTYTVTSPQGTLSQEQKSRIALDITRVHSEATGANTFFAQVLFVESPQGSWFQGGAPAAASPVFVQGQIRAGRPPEIKAALLAGLVDAVANGAGLPKRVVWVYLLELPPSLMVEYGHVLPEPGHESEWLANLPPDERALMERMGH